MVLLAVVVLLVASFAISRSAKVVLGLIGVFIAATVAAGIGLLVTHHREEAERQAARTRIQKSEIKFVQLGLGSNYGTGTYRLAGRVRNQSTRYMLSEMKLKFTMRDCTKRGCEVVGQTEDTVYVNVPPGQARDLNESVYFFGLGTPHGKHEWDYEIVDIFGE